ncbi:hypothetical protein IWW50_001855, partial [Coemansia erecta]
SCRRIFSTRAWLPSGRALAAAASVTRPIRRRSTRQIRFTPPCHLCTRRATMRSSRWSMSRCQISRRCLAMCTPRAC